MSENITNPVKAIRAKCLDCCCGSSLEVANDLNNCSYYNAPAGVECGHSKSNGVCMYQMYGYCPYRFKTEKHCRKIRTLKGEKSNRFNLT